MNNAHNDQNITSDYFDRMFMPIIIEKGFDDNYTDLNTINIDDDEGLLFTCMNMAIGNLLSVAFNAWNVSNYSDWNFPDIKNRIIEYDESKMFSKKDKPDIIRFINSYNENYPNMLPKTAQRFIETYQGQRRNNVHKGHFLKLARTFNTNIYLNELNIKNNNSEDYKTVLVDSLQLSGDTEDEKKKVFWKRRDF
jgi:hypothetical protein